MNSWKTWATGGTPNRVRRASRAVCLIESELISDDVPLRSRAISNAWKFARSLRVRPRSRAFLSAPRKRFRGSG